uniref:Uncharacterized protein n=1 Tax=Romanomermis culicivorax TaxID=13658 RepID=A0A915JKG8_ROMCU
MTPGVVCVTQFPQQSKFIQFLYYTSNNKPEWTVVSGHASVALNFVTFAWTGVHPFLKKPAPVRMEANTAVFECRDLATKKEVLRQRLLGQLLRKSKARSYSTPGHNKCPGNSVLFVFRRLVN